MWDHTSRAFKLSKTGSGAHLQADPEYTFTYVYVVLAKITISQNNTK
jgi:hypothetical protein